MPALQAQILLLLALALTTGVIAGAVRRLLMGRAAGAGGLTAPPPVEHPGRAARVIAVSGAALLALGTALLATGAAASAALLTGAALLTLVVVTLNGTALLAGAALLASGAGGLVVAALGLRGAAAGSTTRAVGAAVESPEPEPGQAARPSPAVAMRSEVARVLVARVAVNRMSSPYALAGAVSVRDGPLLRIRSRRRPCCSRGSLWELDGVRHE